MLIRINRLRFAPSSSILELRAQISPMLRGDALIIRFMGIHTIPSHLNLACNAMTRNDA